MIEIPLCMLIFSTFFDRHLLLIVFFQSEGSVMQVVGGDKLTPLWEVGTHDTHLFLTPFALVRSSGRSPGADAPPLAVRPCLREQTFYVVRSGWAWWHTWVVIIIGLTKQTRHVNR